MLIIPKLDRSDRSREYNNYNEGQCRDVVMAFLFNGKTYREIDLGVLHLDSKYTRGWQSMGILHHLGLKKNFKGLFAGMTVEQAINRLKATKDADYQEIIRLLNIFEDTIERQIEDDILSETETEYVIHTEGKATQYFTTRYERNPINRAQAIRIHGTKCMACGFDFESVYGERGKDYIEVHHIVPLASRNEIVNVNPKTDMIVVCSNCHRMIHRKRNHILSLEELRRIILNNK